MDSLALLVERTAFVRELNLAGLQADAKHWLRLCQAFGRNPHQSIRLLNLGQCAYVARSAASVRLACSPRCCCRRPAAALLPPRATRRHPPPPSLLKLSFPFPCLQPTPMQPGRQRRRRSCRQRGSHGPAGALHRWRWHDRKVGCAPGQGPGGQQATRHKPPSAGRPRQCHGHGQWPLCTCVHNAALGLTLAAALGLTLCAALISPSTNTPRPHSRRASRRCLASWQRQTSSPPSTSPTRAATSSPSSSR